MSGGLNSLLNITNECIKMCLNPICETKHKAQLTASIFKHLIVFQRFSQWNQEPFSMCMDNLV